MVQLPMLEDDSAVQVGGVFLVVVKQFGIEIGTQVDNAFRAVGADDWFRTIKDARRQAGFPPYDDAFDPRFTLKEILIANSPVPGAIKGFGIDWKRDAQELQRRLNRWQHFGVNPTPASLEKVVSLIWNLALLSELPMKDYLAELVIRVRNIRDGVYIPVHIEAPAPTPTFLGPEDQKYLKDLEAKVQEQIQRPPIGGNWVGPLGSRKIVISKALNDITENGVSVMGQLPNGPDLLKAWLRYYPNGGEARVSDDGAVTGFIKGQPTLIGWLGKEPGIDESQARGFLLENEYEYLGNDVRDTQTGLLLSACTEEDIKELLGSLSPLKIGTHFNLSQYGDLTYELAPGQREKLASVHPGIWFPGHLTARK